MRMVLTTAFIAALAAVPATAQTNTAETITLYELPAYLGRSVTVTGATPDLATEGFASRAQSARVTGSWQVCPQASYAGTCRTLTSNQPVLSRSAAVSLRPTSSATSTAATTSTSTGAAAGAAVDVDALDASAGTEGQDVTFYARPSLGGSEVSAGSNDVTAATAFCKLAGATSASAAGRTRAQTSNLIDVTARTRVRGNALRDVVCRK